MILLLRFFGLRRATQDYIRNKCSRRLGVPRIGQPLDLLLDLRIPLPPLSTSSGRLPGCSGRWMTRSSELADVRHPGGVGPVRFSEPGLSILTPSTPKPPASDPSAWIPKPPPSSPPPSRTAPSTSSRPVGKRVRWMTSQRSSMVLPLHPSSSVRSQSVSRSADRDPATHQPEIYTAETHPKGHVVNPGDVVAGMDTRI